jgi:hypothetical protein
MLLAAGPIKSARARRLIIHGPEYARSTEPIFALKRD